MDNVGRRKFLGLSLGGVATVTLAATIYPLYRYLAPRKEANSAGKVEIALKDVPEGGAKFFDYGGASAVLIKKRGGDLMAFSAVCTHLGCIVQWNKEKQEFLCPCHGGQFTADGIVIGGPPPKPLPKLTFTVANGTVTID